VIHTILANSFDGHLAFLNIKIMVNFFCLRSSFALKSEGFSSHKIRPHVNWAVLLGYDVMSSQKYDHQAIEEKWQRFWEDNQTFLAEVDHKKEKYYILDMFPYPSGAGLHVGHVTGYTATDILARYKRQKGFNVLHPMGWDSFGLPAEQYAIRTGTHPSITTQQNIDTYRRQLKSLGFSYDWSREIATSDPRYYKWTQWIFSKLYERGLAYESDALVNYCPALRAVLANEEVENGLSKEGGHPVERRPLRQWVLKITEYAERLLTDLEGIDWPESLKSAQRNWIGKSVGAKATFKVAGTEGITIFTTHAETLVGVTYLVLAPEHPLVSSLTTPQQKEAVARYQKEVSSKSDLQRTELAKEKSGVFLGSYAINPLTEEKVPIWIADYVLLSYGTGAVMGVPAHDERDFDFASQYGLPIVAVIEPDPAEVEGESWEEVKSQVLAGKRLWTGGGRMVHPHSHQLGCFGLPWDQASEAMVQRLQERGAGERCVTYKLRDWLFSRQRYWGEPFPILHFEDGTKRLLDLDELPLSPPELIDFKPPEGGESPLAKATDWVEITDPKTGKRARRETNTMPQWAGSCWYYLRFCDPANAAAAWSREAEEYWMPVDLYVGGVEHAVLHLLYARFWHKVLFDCGLVSTSEPFQTLRNQGLVTARSFQHPTTKVYVAAEEVREEKGHFYQIGTGEELLTQIDKMSKSKLNGITPDEMIEEVGADALRLYEMFMGPFDKEKVWNSEAVQGCRRFLNRFYDLVVSERVTDEENLPAMRLAHKLVSQVEREIEAMQFNTAIAKMMEFINAFAPLPAYPRAALKMATLALAPFAPHMAEEVWEMLGGSSSIAYQPFPKADPKMLEEETILYVVQVNGKTRGSWQLLKELGRDAIIEQLKQEPQVMKHLAGTTEERVIFVPGKLVNFVVGTK